MGVYKKKKKDFCYNKSCCLQTDSQEGGHLQGQYPHSSLKIGKAKLGSTLRHHPYILVFMMWGGTRQDAKKEMGTPIQSHNHWPTICPAWKNILIWFKTLHEKEYIFSTAWVAMTQKLYSPETSWEQIQRPTIRHYTHRESKWDFHQIPPLTAQSRLWRRIQKDCESQRAWRTAGNKVLCNNKARHICAHRNRSIKPWACTSLRQVLCVYIIA